MRTNLKTVNRRRRKARPRPRHTNTPNIEFILSATAAILQYLPCKGKDANNNPTSLKVCVYALVALLYASTAATTLSHNHVLVARITNFAGELSAALAIASLLSIGVGSELTWLPYLSCILPLFPISCDLLRYLHRRYLNNTSLQTQAGDIEAPPTLQCIESMT